MPTQLYILLHQVSFLISGLFQTLCSQWLYYHNATSARAYTTNAAQYFGSFCVAFLLPWLLDDKTKSSSGTDRRLSTSEQAMIAMELPKRDQDNANQKNEVEEDKLVKKNHKGSLFSRLPFPFGTYRNPAMSVYDIPILKITLLDLFANFFLTIGLFYIGSGMYQVIYSSVVVWCALLSTFVGRRLNIIQWLAIIGLSSGLAVTAFEQEGGTAANNSLIGMVITLSATVGYACVYVLSDLLLSGKNTPPHPAYFCYRSGMYASALCAGYLLFYTVPNYSTLLHPTASWERIALAHGLLCISALAHNLNFFALIQHTGSVSTGVLQGMRALLVFGLSHVLFCEQDSAQCFGPWKAWGSLIVAASVFIFNAFR
ncbi:uncharacterized protein VTP21DRAFT_5923 [Calcarisporiella thermophila]|uniref:uncharacterized protein n=1 Tax=Calcarisporiella thermophila TaxID=911321 RepID=UPI003743D792